MADVWAVKDGKVYFIEVKLPDGRLSPEQVQFGEEAIQAGAKSCREASTTFNGAVSRAAGEGNDTRQS